MNTKIATNTIPLTLPCTSDIIGIAIPVFWHLITGPRTVSVKSMAPIQYTDETICIHVATMCTSYIYKHLLSMILIMKFIYGRRWLPEDQHIVRTGMHIISAVYW